MSWPEKIRNRKIREHEGTYDKHLYYYSFQINGETEENSSESLEFPSTNLQGASLLFIFD